MTSSFGWIDFSEADRQKIQEILDLLREKDTRDELGLSSVRDGLADILFPGTSTIQTRARYFLFVPWTYQRLAKKEDPGDVPAAARVAEVKLIKELDAAGAGQGLIGSVAGGDLKRLPSNIYWAGLGVWKIRRFQGSQAQYHRLFRALHRPEGDEHAPEGEHSPVAGGPWDPLLPRAPDGFPSNVTFELTRIEATYLQQCIQAVGPSLLGYLVRPDTVFEDTQFPWARSDAAGWPEPFATQVTHARRFSEAVHGAVLLYNVLVAEAAEHESWAGQHRDEFSAWANAIELNRQLFATWDQPAFWRMLQERAVRVPLPAFRFIESWLDLLARGPANQLVDDPRARELVRDREQRLKGRRSRLANPSARAMWSGASGTTQLNYRWHRVQQVIADILAGIRST